MSRTAEIILLRAELGDALGRNARLVHTLNALLDTLSSIETNEGFAWTEADRAEFEAMAGIRK